MRAAVGPEFKLVLEKFPWNPGPYYKTNSVFEGKDMPIW